MTNAGGHVLSNVELGHIYPYQSLRPNAKNIYTKLHDDTFNTVFGCQVTDDAAEKQYTKKSLEWSTVGKGDVLKKALTNNPPELPKMQYGYDSVDMLQNKMSEGNLKSKVKKDVFNFYGMDPPPTGHPEREMVNQDQLNQQDGSFVSAPPQQMENISQVPVTQSTEPHQEMGKNNDQFYGANHKPEEIYQNEKSVTPREQTNQDQQYRDSGISKSQVEPLRNIGHDPNFSGDVNKFYGNEAQITGLTPSAQDPVRQSQEGQQMSHQAMQNRYAVNHRNNMVDAFPLNAYQPTGRHDAHRNLDLDYDANTIRWKYAPTSSSYGNNVPVIY